MVGFDHLSKQKCLILQITDFDIDREVIDKVEHWHKERHQEIFYTYQPIK